MALDSNGLELLNRQPEAHVSVDNMLVLIHWVSNLLTLAKNSRADRITVMVADFQSPHLRDERGRS